jgi:hypothetical protein
VGNRESSYGCAFRHAQNRPPFRAVSWASLEAPQNSVGCSVCGYSVDVIRSCYESKWNFPAVGNVRGYYYFSAPGAPFYPGWSFFGSRNWHKGDGTSWPEFGELENTKQKWRDGSFGTTRPDYVTIGTAAQIDGDDARQPPAPAGSLFGVPYGCWPRGVPFPGPGQGGEELGQESTESGAFSAPAAGGEELGELAADLAGYVAPAAGGEELGELAADLAGYVAPAAGGEELGELAADLAGYVAPAAGGEELGGDHETTVNYTSRTNVDNMGQGTITFTKVAYDAPATGGVKLGGTSTDSKHP